MKNIIIMNLGDIVKQNMFLAITKMSIISGIQAEKLLKMLQEPEIEKLITDFKLGKEDESFFCNFFVNRINKEACTTISEDDFHEAWSVMNPALEQYEHLLQEISNFNTQYPNYEIFLISYTNSLDIKDMNKNGVDIDLNRPNLLNGIHFYASYYLHLKAPYLLNKIVMDYGVEEVQFTYIFTNKNAAETKKLYGINPQEMLDMCNNHEINSLCWDQEKSSLSEILIEAQVAHDIVNRFCSI